VTEEGKEGRIERYKFETTSGRRELFKVEKREREVFFFLLAPNALGAEARLQKDRLRKALPPSPPLFLADF